MYCAKLQNKNLSSWHGISNGGYYMGNWETALECFCKKAKENHIDFYLIGSATASIRGIDIIPHDLDIIVDVTDFWKAGDVFKDSIIMPFLEASEDDEVVKFFGKIRVSNIDIDISAKPKNIYGRHRIEMLCWNGYIIKTQTLELLREVYDKNNRHEYVKAIDDYLAQLIV